MKCRNCGETVDPRRVELGYDYCTKPDCQRRFLKRVELARVAVNKAADQFVRADEVRPDDLAPRYSGVVDGDEVEGDEVDGDEEPHPEPRSRPSDRPASRQRTTAIERLRAAEARLDAQLDDAYQRFSAGEITAKEMHAEQRALIEEFNSKVRAENIRYRSFLR